MGGYRRCGSEGERNRKPYRIKGVKEGTATIKATIAYNGKSQTLAECLLLVGKKYA